MASCIVLGTEVFEPSLFEQSVEKVIVQSPYTLIFELKNGETNISQWKYDERSKQYTEVTNGENSYDDTGYIGDILLAATEGEAYQTGCGIRQGLNG